MKPEDIDALLAIDRKISEVEGTQIYRDLVRQVLGGQMDVSSVAEIEDRVIGFLVAYRADVPGITTEVCVIQLFGVDPDQWRQGVATKMIRAELESCRRKGITSVHVRVEGRDPRLEAFFKSLGFDRDPRSTDYSKKI
jgi:GNAT superfamily N-acetyltransferase